MNIAIIRTGTANLASVVAAFHRLDTAPRVVTRAGELRPDDAVVLPGVGAFAAGMAALTESGWDHVLKQRFAAGQPTLAICLGLQLLCRESDESPAVRGLEILPTSVRRLPDNVTVPHFGWNQIASAADFFEDGCVYYANSYCAADVDAVARAGWEVATTTHGIPFVAAVRRGAWLACQFHPELSGELGQRLLSRWLQRAELELGSPKSSTERSPC